MRERNGGVDERETHGHEPTDSAKIKKKTYCAPILENYGTLDALTAGGQGGAGDSHGGPNTKTPCWIAEILYGSNDGRTHLLRMWLTRVYARTTTGAAVVAVYRACGARVAGWARRSKLLRRILTPLFDAGVAAALRHYTLAAR